MSVFQGANSNYGVVSKPVTNAYSFFLKNASFVTPFRFAVFGIFGCLCVLDEYRTGIRHPRTAPLLASGIGRSQTGAGSRALLVLP